MNKIITAIILIPLSLSSFAGNQFNTKLSTKTFSHLKVESISYDGPQNGGTTVKSQCVIDLENTNPAESEINILNFCDNKIVYSDVTSQCNDAINSLNSIDKTFITISNFQCENTNILMTFENFKISDYKNDVLLSTLDISNQAALDNLKEEISLNLLATLSFAGVKYVDDGGSVAFP